MLLLLHAVLLHIYVLHLFLYFFGTVIPTHILPHLIEMFLLLFHWVYSLANSMLFACVRAPPHFAACGHVKHVGNTRKWRSTTQKCQYIVAVFIQEGTYKDSFGERHCAQEQKPFGTKIKVDTGTKLVQKKKKKRNYGIVPPLRVLSCIDMCLKRLIAAALEALYLLRYNERVSAVPTQRLSGFYTGFLGGWGGG